MQFGEKLLYFALGEHPLAGQVIRAPHRFDPPEQLLHRGARSIRPPRVPSVAHRHSGYLYPRLDHHSVTASARISPPQGVSVGSPHAVTVNGHRGPEPLPGGGLRLRARSAVSAIVCPTAGAAQRRFIRPTRGVVRLGVAIVASGRAKPPTRPRPVDPVRDRCIPDTSVQEPHPTTRRGSGGRRSPGTGGHHRRRAPRRGAGRRRSAGARPRCSPARSDPDPSVPGRRSGSRNAPGGSRGRSSRRSPLQPAQAASTSSHRLTPSVDVLMERNITLDARNFTAAL